MSARIGLVTYALDRAPGGIGRYTRELMDALRKAGLELTLLRAGVVSKDVSAAALPGASLLPGLLTLGQAEIAWIARRRGLNLVHDPTGCTPLMLTGVPRVVTIHDAIPYIHPETSTLLDRLIYRCWLPLAVRCVDAIITVSRQGKSDITKFLPVRPEKVKVIPEAAGECFRPITQAEVYPVLREHGISFPYILYVGSIEPRKNLVRLLEAYARLRCWSQQWRLVIVGARKSSSARVSGAVQRLKLDACVHFTGYVRDEELPALYSGADLLVFPSLYEGFGLPVLEAMACGTPVVTSNVSSLPEVAGDAALLADPFDPEAIAHAMRLVLDDPVLAADMRSKGLARARQFGWERTARETIDVYEEVLEQRLVRVSA